MFVYLAKIRDRLVALKNGVTIHAADWAGQPETPVTIQANIDAIDVMQADINTLEDQFSQKRAAARQLVKEDSVVSEMFFLIPEAPACSRQAL